MALETAATRVMVFNDFIGMSVLFCPTLPKLRIENGGHPIRGGLESGQSRAGRGIRRSQTSQAPLDPVTRRVRMESQKIIIARLFVFQNKYLRFRSIENQVGQESAGARDRHLRPGQSFQPERDGQDPDRFHKAVALLPGAIAFVA